MTVTNRDKIQNYSTQMSQEHLLCNEFDWIIFSYAYATKHLSDENIYFHNTF